MNAEIGQNHGYEPGVGALLRASRLRRGEELQDIAALLRIRFPFLEAIEDGRYQELPGSAYAIGFVRTYAEHLGLDSEEVVRRFKAEAENLERRSDLVFPSPIAERSTPGGAIVFVGILMAAVAYGAWYLGTSKQSFLDDLVSPLPERLTAMIRGDGETSGTAPSAAPSNTTSNAPTSAPEASQPATPTAEPAPTPPAGQTAAPPTQIPVPTAAPSEPPVKAAPAPSPQPPVVSKPVATPPPTPTPPAAAPTPAPATPAAPAAAPAEPSRTPAVARVEPPASAPSAPATPPVRPTPPAPAVTTTPAASVPSEAPALPPAAPPATPPAPPAVPAAAPAQPPVPPVATAEAPATGQAAASTDAPAGASSRIVVRAKLDSWIQVRDGVGRRLLVTRLLRAGETYQVPNQPSLSLLTGNAGGLEILVDGQPVPAIGGVGTVRRDVALEADRLKAGTAVVD